jgi:hypothetical protein
MRPVPISVPALCTLVLGWAVPLIAQQAPCAQITAACKDAGFTLGGASNGTGLQLDCVVPIMQGLTQPSAATRPLPQVDPQVVAACKASHPTFGQVKGPTPTADVRRAPTSAARQLAPPASPLVTGAAVTSAAGNTPNSSLATGARSVEPGIPSEPGEDPKGAKSWALTCLIGPQEYEGATVGLKGSTASVSISSSGHPVSAGLDTGNCAFKDRALKYPQEPSFLCFDGSSIRAVGFVPSEASTGTKSRSSTYPITLATGLRFDGSGAEVLSSALNGPNQRYTFMVHSGHMGGISCFIVDKFAKGDSPPP